MYIYNHSYNEVQAAELLKVAYVNSPSSTLDTQDNITTVAPPQTTMEFRGVTQRHISNHGEIATWISVATRQLDLDNAHVRWPPMDPTTRENVPTTGIQSTKNLQMENKK